MHTDNYVKPHLPTRVDSRTYMYVRSQLLASTGALQARATFFREQLTGLERLVYNDIQLVNYLVLASLQACKLDECNTLWGEPSRAAISATPTA